MKGIFLDASTTVENYMTTNDIVTTRVNGYLKDFKQKGRERYMNDASVKVTMEIPLDGIGGIYDAILGSTLEESSSVTEFKGKKSKKEIVFTGLIIDCKGLAIKPALSPKIYDEDGREVYGSAYVTKEWVVKYGIVGYSKSVKDAAKLDRVGDKPGQIKAVKASGDNKTDIVISEEDAKDIRSAVKNLKFLSQCRVVFVID